ncbi:MAG: putative DNA binding domain-containing protein [bacterium]|nr:putative DNA binding domain-containing protein [Acidimicrobiia bacterium]MCY4650726.1 putative DNA binding domain-containing protein [bacterium]
MTTTAVERALGADPSSCGALLCQVPESQWFDRKSPRVTARDLAIVLVGFANADGGVVVVGLHGGHVEGIDRSGPRCLAEWQQAAIDFTVPVVPVAMQVLTCRNDRGDEDHLLAIRVKKSNVVHATVADQVYLRVGDETRKLRFDQRRELLHDKGQTIYEATSVPDASGSDLDADLIESWVSAVGGEDGHRLLAARGLVNRDRHFTIAGVLLFGMTPQAWLPQARVRVLRYRGRARGAGRDQQLEIDVQVDGPLPHQIEEGGRVLVELVPTRRALGRDGKFQSVPIIPSDVWREGLVNAVVHRSYSLAGDHIRIEVFEDRIEVHSPGRFPGLANGVDPREVMRYARNPNIARVCADLRFGQELGEGIRRMFERMRQERLADPVYEQGPSSVRLTLFAHTVDPNLEDGLPKMAQQILQLLRAEASLSTGDLVAATRRSRPAVLHNLRTLQSAGIIKWVGRSPRDPHAYWTLHTRS